MAYQDKALDTWLEITKELASIGNIISFQTGFDFRYSVVIISVELFAKYKDWWKKRKEVNKNTNSVASTDLGRFILELQRMQRRHINQREALLEILDVIANNKQLIRNYNFKAEIGEYFHVWAEVWYHCDIEKILISSDES